MSVAFAPYFRVPYFGYSSHSVCVKVGCGTFYVVLCGSQCFSHLVSDFSWCDILAVLDSVDIVMLPLMSNVVTLVCFIWLSTFIYCLVRAFLVFGDIWCTIPCGCWYKELVIICCFAEVFGLHFFSGAMVRSIVLYTPSLCIVSSAE